jgi:hypothetical protein
LNIPRKEEVPATITQRRRILIRIRCGATIVRNLGILQMNVGSRKVKRMMK